MVKRLIAIDPGQTTGYVEVMFHPETGLWDVTDVREITWDCRFDLKPLVADVLVPGHPLLFPSFVVCERFILYPHKAQDQIGSEFPSVRVIGVLEAFLWELGLLEVLRFQNASVRERVKVLPADLSKVGHSPHTIDAYQHIRYFIVSNEKLLING